MPAFGSPGFSATKQQTQQYRTASPAPAPQPALSMPAYTQASGAGAAQPIQPAVASTTQRPRGTSKSPSFAPPAAGAFGTPEYSARVMEEGRKNPSSLFYQREYTAEERAQSAANVAAEEARVQRQRQKSGLSQSTFDWARSGKQERDAPTYEVWQELAANSGGRLDAGRSAYDARVEEQQKRQAAINRLYDPMYGYKPGSMTTPDRPGVAKFEYGNDYSIASAREGDYAAKTPEEQAEADRKAEENARQMANWNKAREEATANGIDFATGRPLKEVSAPGNSGAYVVNAAGQPVSIASQREKAAAEGWDYDTGKWLTTQAADADKQRRTDALIKRLG